MTVGVQCEPADASNVSGVCGRCLVPLSYRDGQRLRETAHALEPAVPTLERHPDVDVQGVANAGCSAIACTWHVAGSGTARRTA
jgi:hypothetical protein